jgi:2-oxoglutarate ferredoxin oxidoreductase subunit gamma
MANTDVLMAGFGGQGLMAIGKILAKAVMEDGRNVTWMPSYGPEMRGGTANCVVIIDDEPIGSPIVRQTYSAIVMNKQSIDKFEPTIREGGLLVVNTSLIDRKVARADLRAVYVPATELAEKEGTSKAANMVMLGAYVGASKIVSQAVIEHAIEATFAGKRGSAGDVNLRAFRRGFEIGSSSPA